MTTPLIKCSEFVKRQTPNSGYSHFDGSWEELEKIVESSFKDPRMVRPGYKEGVCLVDLNTVYTTNYVDPNRFYSGIIEINSGTKLQVTWAPRLLGEESFIRVSSKAKKPPAKHVSFVLYRADILAEDDNRSTNAEWEIIAIKARVSNEEEPMDPYTMARNYLHLKGGTKGDFTALQFAESILYWNRHCMMMGRKSWLERLNLLFKKVNS